MIDVTCLCMGTLCGRDSCPLHYYPTLQEYNLRGLKGAADQIADKCYRYFQEAAS